MIITFICVDIRRLQYCTLVKRRASDAATLKNIFAVLKMINIGFPYNPMTLLIVTYRDKMKTYDHSKLPCACYDS